MEFWVCWELTKGRSHFNSLFVSNETRWGRSEDRSAIAFRSEGAIVNQSYVLYNCVNKFM
ncbi:hypothetical protein QUB60_07465 [Microcoleus sp. A2-C5]